MPRFEDDRIERTRPSQPREDQARDDQLPAKTADGGSRQAHDDARVSLRVANVSRKQLEPPEGGIYAGRNGNSYVRIGSNFYQVQRDDQMNTWVVVDPDNPHAFAGRTPIVRDNTTGEWRVARRGGLKGGMLRSERDIQNKISKASVSLARAQDDLGIAKNQLSKAEQDLKMMDVTNPSSSAFVPSREEFDRFNMGTANLRRDLRGPGQPAESLGGSWGHVPRPARGYGSLLKPGKDRRAAEDAVRTAKQNVEKAEKKVEGAKVELWTAREGAAVMPPWWS